MHEILALLDEEEEDRDAEVYIEPNDPGLLTGEDSADKDDSGLVDYLSGRQLALMLKLFSTTDIVQLKIMVKFN